METQEESGELEQLYKAQEAAELLSCSVRWLNMQVAKGRLRKVYLGTGNRTPRYRKSELLKLMRCSRREGGEG